MNIIEQMIADKIAKNAAHAYNIYAGLQLAELKTEQEMIDRYKLYRQWRDAGERSKIAFQKAIDGIRLVELFEWGVCSVCGETFTASAWRDRHTDSDGGDCHEECCDVCEKEATETPAA